MSIDVLLVLLGAAIMLLFAMSFVVGAFFLAGVFLGLAWIGIEWGWEVARYLLSD